MFLHSVSAQDELELLPSFCCLSVFQFFESWRILMRIQSYIY